MKPERHWYFVWVYLGAYDMLIPMPSLEERTRSVRELPFEYKLSIGGDGYAVLRSNVPDDSVLDDDYKDFLCRRCFDAIRMGNPVYFVDVP